MFQKSNMLSSAGPIRELSRNGISREKKITVKALYNAKIAQNSKVNLTGFEPVTNGSRSFLSSIKTHPAEAILIGRPPRRAKLQLPSAYSRHSAVRRIEKLGHADGPADLTW